MARHSAGGLDDHRLDLAPRRGRRLLGGRGAEHLGLADDQAQVDLSGEREGVLEHPERGNRVARPLEIDRQAGSPEGQLGPPDRDRHMPPVEFPPEPLTDLAFERRQVPRQLDRRVVDAGG